MLNETTSPSSSSSPQSPSYYILSSDNGPSNPQSPTLAHLQARALASQQPSHSEPEPEVTSPPLEHQNPTTSEQPQTPSPAQQPNPPPEQPINSEPQPIHSPAEPNSQPKQTTLSPSSIPTPPTSVASITPTLNLGDTNPPSPSSPTSSTEPETTFPTLEEAIKVFLESSVDKIKSLTINSGISDDPSKAKANAETEEAARVAAEEAAKAKANALTQGEHSNFGFAPMVLKTLEELQKEQQVVRVRLDQQDSVNINIQNMLPQLLQRMPPPPNP
ncbi:pollen-specific leucine-rich repeat extensin-like protein 2 [Lathyrus oleraceus]|uniref:pollen-specific leucine-rich repeat extensin-like protein 2 n=1 Tax=Pisum sativum TaxID=3888 RepID=UPI0021CDF3FE|nr:pollen-specific leucine-rich repeat extensin-like protein 2 [Pisum sativum]